MTKRDRIPDSVRRDVLAANCAYCGYPWPTEVDHVHPYSRGGSDDRSNLAPACGTCNAEKLDFTPQEWRAWRESEGKPWPPEGRAGIVRAAIQSVLDGGVTEEELLAAVEQQAQRLRDAS
ncbi:HNH endonuclease [Streptomyces pristinaespiralis]|uniref:HNH endonuclease n=1 Tax=Streptomyces pristinaespiralis TaxID=38300 RepID=UPI0037925132